MANIGLVVMNSKGQIVLPSSIRGYFVKGEKLYFVKNNNQFILRKMKETKNQGDLEFAIETEAAWKRIEKGQAIQLDFDDFLSQLSKW